MPALFQRGWWLAAIAASLLLPVRADAATNSLTWRAAENRVDADIHDWPLDTLLKEIAANTGWQVFAEPNLPIQVSTKFKDLPPGDALRRLLDSLNFALLPQSNAPSHLLVFRTSIQEATLAVRAPSTNSSATAHAKAIPNELIVRLKAGADIEAIARALGAKVVGRLDKLNAYRLQFENAEAAELARAALAQNPDVTSVDSNYAYDLPPNTRDVASTSISPLQLKARSSTCDGKVIVGLLDTPVQKLDGNLNDFLLPAVSVVGNTQTSPTAPTHGTAMAETLLRGLQAASGSSSAARVLPVDIYGANPSTTTFDVGMGVYKAVNSGATILNLSLGSDGDSPFLHDLLQQASKQGVMIFAAAGNAPVTTPTYPAAYPEVIAVTAGDKRGQIASYANHGSFVDLVAPGSNIIYFNGQPYYVSGTSAATAFASGLAAGLSDCSRTPAQVETALRATLGSPPAP
jgi:thermitase